MVGLNKLSNYRFIISSFAAALVLVAGGTVWAYYALRDITQPLILHYNGQYGISQTGNIWNLTGFGITGLVVLTLNFGMSLVFEQADSFWGKIVAVASLILGILIFIGFAAIISVN